MSPFEKRTRLHASVDAVLHELRSIPPTSVAAERMARLTRQLVVELASSLSEPELKELGVLIGDLDEHLSLGESRVVTAQILGWLDGVTRSEVFALQDSALEVERSMVARAQQEAELERARRARGVL
jgi:hypothetical protein